VVQIQIQYQQAIRDYIARRTAEGKTSREIKRCLARYIAREGVLPMRLKGLGGGN
jgi:hypothetical protein